MTHKEQYLSILSIHAKPQSVKAYGFYIDTFLNYCRKPENKIDLNDLSNFARIIKIKYKSKSVEIALFVVRSYMRYLSESGVSDINLSRMRIPRGYSEREDPITPEEYVAILATISARTELGIRDNMIVRLLYDTGARVGELAQLNGAINPDEMYLTIHTEKTSDARIISWSNDTAFFVKSWMKLKKNRPLIPSTRTIERIVTRYAEAAGIKKRVHPHLFRHSKAHYILDNGGTVRDVQDILGHKSPISSFMYLRWNEDKRLERHKRFLSETKVDKSIQGEYSGIYAKTINLSTEDSIRPQEEGLENAQGRYEHTRHRTANWQKSYLGSERHQRVGIPQRGEA